MMHVVAGLLLGVATSVHCAAMCGPLMAIVRQSPAGRAWGGLALYHASRLLTYAAFGALAGAVGAGFVRSGFGQGLSIAAGVLLLGMAVGRLGWPMAGVARAGAWVGQVAAKATGRARSLGLAGLVAAGAANAFLPCGLLAASVVAAAALGDPLDAAMSTMAFGVGTTPAVVAVWWSLGSMRRLWPARAAFVTPALLVVTGLLLIGRGLSPAVHEHAPAAAPAVGAAGPSAHAH